jgi:hypothetical protein
MSGIGGTNPLKFQPHLSGAEMNNAKHEPTTAACTPALALCLLLAGAGMAVAAEMSDAEKDALRSSCRSDYFSFCSSVPRGPAVLTCLQKNIASVSSGCRQALSKLGGAAAPPSAATKTAPAPAACPRSGDARGCAARGS